MSKEYFNRSLLYFRKIMCSTKYSFEEKERAYSGLATDYFRCELSEDDIVHFQSISREWEIRSLYEKQDVN